MQKIPDAFAFVADLPADLLAPVKDRNRVPSSSRSTAGPSSAQPSSSSRSAENAEALIGTVRRNSASTSTENARSSQQGTSSSLQRDWSAYRSTGFAEDSSPYSSRKIFNFSSSSNLSRSPSWRPSENSRSSYNSSSYRRTRRDSYRRNNPRSEVRTSERERRNDTRKDDVYRRPSPRPSFNSRPLSIAPDREPIRASRTEDAHHPRSSSSSRPEAIVPKPEPMSESRSEEAQPEPSPRPSSSSRPQGSAGRSDAGRENTKRELNRLLELQLQQQTELSTAQQQFQQLNAAWQLADSELNNRIFIAKTNGGEQGVSPNDLEEIGRKTIEWYKLRTQLIEKDAECKMKIAQLMDTEMKIGILKPLIQPS